MENQAFHKKGHGMAWDQNAKDLLHLQTCQNLVKSGRFSFPGNDKKFHVLEKPALTEKRI